MKVILHIIQKMKIKIEKNFKNILYYLGENPKRTELKDTPARYIKFLKEFLTPVKFNFTTFSSNGYKGIIIQRNIPFQSLCEHHCIPFWGIATIAYIPNKKIVGLSKLTRCLNFFSRKLQNQEKLTLQIITFINNKLKPKGVFILLKARHMCMEMRGVKKDNLWTITSQTKGIFKSKNKYKNIVLNLINESSVDRV